MVRTYRRPLRLHVPKTLFRKGFYGFNHFRSGQRTACVCVCVCVCVCQSACRVCLCLDAPIHCLHTARTERCCRADLRVSESIGDYASSSGFVCVDGPCRFNPSHARAHSEYIRGCERALGMRGIVVIKINKKVVWDACIFVCVHVQVRFPATLWAWRTRSESTPLSLSLSLSFSFPLSVSLSHTH